jgi:hypothetical protein
MRGYRNLQLLLGVFVLLATGLLAGCGWQGEGKDVAAALQKSTEINTRQFNGSISVNIPAMQLGQDGGGEPTQMTMKFSGKSDNSNPADPKGEFSMALSEGSSQQMDFTIVSPGGDTAYLTTDGKSYSFPITAEQRASQTVDPSKIYGALATAVGDFKQSQPMKDGQGASVPTTSAKIDREKLCGPVLEAFGDAFKKSMQLDGGLGGGGASGMTGSVDGGKMFQSMCKSMLKEDPKLWFGIRSGVLTDVAMEADIAVPFAGNVKVSVQYHETGQGEPVTIEAPANAQPLGSIDQMADLLTPPRS